jgi:hypothetical protein
LGGLQFFCVKFHKGGDGVFAFLLETSKVGLLCWYFKVPKSSIFFLSF